MSLPDFCPHVQTPATVRDRKCSANWLGPKGMLRPPALLHPCLPPPGLASAATLCERPQAHLPAQQKELPVLSGFSKRPRLVLTGPGRVMGQSLSESLWPGQQAGLRWARPGHVTTGSRGRVHGVKYREPEGNSWGPRGKPDCCHWGAVGPLPSPLPHASVAPLALALARLPCSPSCGPGQEPLENIHSCPGQL